MKKLLLSILIFPSLLNAQNFGNSLHFDGNDDYVSTALPAVFSGISSNDITAEVWIKPQGNTFSRVLFAQFSTSSFFSISLQTSNQVYFYVNNVGVASVSSLPLNQWTHVSCVWKASTQQKQVYFNGVLQNTTSGGGSSTGANNLMTIGSRTDGSQYFQGELDELRIWSVERTFCEIVNHMNNEFNESQPNLEAYYKFNEGTAGSTNTGVTSLPDFTTNYNGTLTNFALDGTSSNWVSSGAQYLENGSGTSEQTQVSCEAFTWTDGDGETYNSSTTITHVIPNGAINGCDSTIILNLTINHPTDSTFTATACGSYTLNDTTYTTSGTHVQVISNANNCDSTITLNLTINNVDTTVSISGLTLTADQTGATYQWIDCDNGNLPISGETAQSFTPTANGNYAVEVTANGCTETSTCIVVNSVGIDKNSLATLQVFPNPGNGLFTVKGESLNNTASIKVINALGQELNAKTIVSNGIIIINLTNETTGVYLLKVDDGTSSKVVRLIKQ